MIRSKKLEVPDVRASVLRITPAYLKKSERVMSYAPVGMCEEAGKFVVAEGSVDIGEMDTPAQQFYAVCGELFWRTGAGSYVRFSDRKSFGRNVMMRQFVSYPSTVGTTDIVMVGEDAIFWISGDDTKDLTPVAGVGTCAAVHHERMFIGNGNTLRYSAPLDIGDWSSDTAGSIDLPTTGGEILALLSFKERIYVFRKWEILRLHADAKDLNFKLERVHVDYGKFLEGSLQPCGEKFVFATKRGLVTGDGTSFRYVPTSRLGAALSEPVQSAHSDGKYYALVTRENGLSCILVYDPETDSHHFLDIDADLLTGVGEGVYYGHETRIFRLTQQGFLAYATMCCSLEATLEIGDADGEGGRIDAVSVIGKGAYLLTLTTEKGSCTVEVQGGEKVHLPRVLRGQLLKLQLYATDGNCTVSALNLHFREETP